MNDPNMPKSPKSSPPAIKTLSEGCVCVSRSFVLGGKEISGGKKRERDLFWIFVV